MAVLSWNEILQRDKQAQMTGAEGLTPEQLGAIRSAELTEGAVNARNIFNQNEINRRNAVAEKNASDMLSANKRAQNFDAAIKLGMMAKEYYPEISGAVEGIYDSVTGAKTAVAGAGGASAGVSAAIPAGEAGIGVGLGTDAGVGAGLGSSSGVGAGLGAGTTTAGLGAAIMPGIGAGAAAPAVLNMIRPTATENIGRTVSFGAIEHEKTKRQVGGTATGAAAGALAGAAATAWSGPGAIVGAIVGGLSGLASESCIIVTACTDRNSYEVEITRQYRDKYLDHNQIKGYYCLAEKIVPTIVNHEKVRNLVKKHLVDRLVDYGETKLGLKDKCKLSSRIVSYAFLGLIKTVGFLIPKYTRLNGEVYE